jgi:chromosome segregation ATPase
MTFPPAPAHVQAPTPALQQLVNEAVQSAMTNGVKKMLDEYLERQAEWHNLRMRSLDEHLNRAEVGLSQARRGFEEAERQFNTTVRSLSEDVGGAKTAITRLDEDLNRLRTKVSGIEERVRSLETGHGVLILSHDELRRDIFGTPDSPDVPFLARNINTQYQAIMNKLDNIVSQHAVTNKQVQEHEQFIAQRKTFERWMVGNLKGLWANKTYRLLFIGGVILVVGALPNIEIWQRIIQVVIK